MADNEKKGADPNIEELNVEDPKRKGSNPFIPILFICLTIPLLSYVMFQFIFIPMMKTQVLAINEALKEDTTVLEGHEKSDGDLQIYALGDLVSNLSGSRQNRYLKVSISIEGKDAKTADGAIIVFNEFMENNRPKILDLVGGIVSSIQLSELDEPGIRNLTRKKIMDSLNTNLQGPNVINLYFSEWVVQ